MQIDHSRLILPNVIGELTTILKSAFSDHTNARIDTSVTNSNFLVIPFISKNVKYAILVEISESSLNILKGGEMNLIYPFEHPEKGFFYLAQLDDENDSIQKLAYYSPNDRDFEWPIPSNQSIDFKWVEKPKPFKLVEYAKQRNRIAIEFIVEFNDFKDSTIKAESIKKYLIPFNELVKTALLSNIGKENKRYNAKTIEKVLHMGFSKIEFKCLSTILEFDFNQSPQSENSELTNILNLYYLLDCENEKEIENNFKNFQNPKLIVQYLTLLKNVISDRSRISSRLATPAKHEESFYLDRQRSMRLKKMISNDHESITYEENVVGVLVLLEHDPSKKYSHFSLKSIVDDKPYKGRISNDLRKSVEERSFKLVGQEYDCKLKVTFTPESTTHQEDYEYELIEIEPADKSVVEYPNREINTSE